MDTGLAERLLQEVRSKRQIELDSLAERLKVNIDKLRGIIEELKKKGAIKVSVKVDRIVLPGPRLLSLKGLPEIIIFNILKDFGEVDLDKLKSLVASMETGDFKAGLGKLASQKIISITRSDGKRVVKLLSRSSRYIDKVNKMVKLLLDNPNGVDVAKLDSEAKKIINELSKRPGIIIEKEIRKTFVSPGEKLEYVIKELGEEITSLTPEIIVSGLWKKKRFKEYDLNERVFIATPAKLHPIHELVNEIREIFLNMGFIEARGPLVELAFVNFDMLFQPQDHPARDMQDTFYIKHPKYGTIHYPKEVVEHVKETHESGWRTGSTGWGGKWSIDEAKKLLLRTHTTAVSVRKVYELGETEAKIFSIGKVFRNETVDYKHLAEFMQIDGIVISKNGNVRELMGIIKEFYTRLGFKNVKFWPSYFPYTEPSLQPSIYVDKWGKWLELGGAGIFRPEVTYPLGVKWPVLAWGLGIERILMIKYDLDDIRIIYDNNLRWLRHLSIFG